MKLKKNDIENFWMKNIENHFLEQIHKTSRKSESIWYARLNNSFSIILNIRE